MEVRAQNKLSWSILFLVLLAGCLKLNSVSQDPMRFPSPQRESPSSSQQISEPTSLPRPSPSPSATIEYFLPEPLPTFPATASPNQVANLVALLQSDQCQLPCYLGIIPGITSWSEAQIILDTIGAGYVGKYMDDGLEAYHYQLWIGDETMEKLTRVPNTAIGDLEIMQHLDITIGDDKVQRIKIDGQTSGLRKKFFELYSSETHLTS